MWWLQGVAKQIQIRWTAKARICQNISTLRLNATEVSISSLWVCWNIFKHIQTIISHCQIMSNQSFAITDDHAATSHQPGGGGRVTTSPSGTLWTPSAEANFCRSSVGSACRDRMIATGWSCVRVNPRFKACWTNNHRWWMWLIINFKKNNSSKWYASSINWMWLMNSKCLKRDVFRH